MDFVNFYEHTQDGLQKVEQIVQYCLAAHVVMSQYLSSHMKTMNKELDLRGFISNFFQNIICLDYPKVQKKSVIPKCTRLSFKSNISLLLKMALFIMQLKQNNSNTFVCCDSVIVRSLIPKVLVLFIWMEHFEWEKHFMTQLIAGVPNLMLYVLLYPYGLRMGCRLSSYSCEGR